MSDLYSKSEITKSSPHIRLKTNVQTIFTKIVLTLIPIVVFGSYNIGYNAIKLSNSSLVGVRFNILKFFGLDVNHENVFICFFYGFMWFLPLFVVSFFTAKLVEFAFCKLRKKEPSGGIMLISLLYSLTLPPSLPLWQAVVGMFFGVLVAREVFGGLGKNFMNPALAGRAFIFFSYPATMSGNSVWTVVDGYSGATALSIAGEFGLLGLEEKGFSWLSMFFGNMTGSIGETSAFLCLLGAIFLILSRVISWRIVLGAVLGVMFMSGIFNVIGSSNNPMFIMPWHWHLVMGGFAFALVFMATDPVTSCETNIGRWIFGFFVGFMTILIRVANPSFPEGVMMAILLANVIAPFIDYLVAEVNIKRRLKRNVP